MATTEFLSLDTTGIEGGLLQADQPLAKVLDYRKQLNLALNNLGAESRLANYQGQLKKLLPNQEEIRISDLNKVLESYLCTLLSTSTIGSLDGKNLSSHFCRRKLLVAGHFQGATSDFLDTLVFTNQKTWGTSYGTLGYQLNRLSKLEHYLSPSEIVELTSRSYFGLESIFQTLGLRLQTLMNQDSLDADYLLYQTSIELVNLESFKQVNKQFQFYQSWLPKVIEFYLSPLRSGTPLQSQTLNQKSAQETLSQIAQYCLRLGIETIPNLTYELMHQTLAPAFFSFLDELSALRASSLYDLTNAGTSLEELLVIELLTEIPSNTQSNIRTLNYQILKELGPGGFNLFLVTLASVLLNRAYILSHPTQTIYKDYLIYPIQINLPELLLLIGRLYKLLYYAGYLLLKSNLEHLQGLGKNLIVLTGLDSPSPILELNN